MPVNQNHIQSVESYISSPRKKDYYQTLYDFFNLNQVTSVLDVGSASGDFAWYSPSHINYSCVDVSSELINVARSSRCRSNIKHLCANILTTDIVIDPPDAITLLGTLCTFNDPTPLFEKLSTFNSKYLIIVGSFNPSGFDVQVSHRHFSSNLYQNSNNIFSFETIQRILSPLGYSQFSTQRYNLTTRLKKSELSTSSITNYHAYLDNELVLTSPLDCIFRQYIQIYKLDG